MNKRSGFAETNEEYRKFSISLSQDTEFFLDDLQREIRIKKGFRVSKSEIIRASLRYLKALKPDLRNIKDENDLLERFLKSGENLPKR